IIKHISFETKITNLGGVEDPSLFDEILTKTISLKDSVGGIVKVTAKGVEVGLGEPYFDSLESCIAHLLYSVGGVKGVSFGTGFDGVALLGSEFNDCIIDETGKTKTNHSGGINGGISNGNDIIVNVFVKPTASIFKSQETYHFKNQQLEPLILEGRHDSAIILRAQVVLEACVAIALADAYLIRKTQK
ncbi:MAG: chorismate synthase, partial [Anaeroplasmataceae bacterium]|nr:chorismate synthase [Anaeroplasmataceae bacterium]